MSTRDKRICQRFTVRDAKVGVLPKTLKTFFQKARKGHLLLIDISMTGVRILTKEKFEKGAVLDLHIDIPATPDPIRAKARVAWCRKHPKLEKYETGAEFVKIPPRSLTIISKLESASHLRKQGRDGILRL